MGLALAVVAALLYGGADFFGGIASRRTPAIAVVVLSQAAGLALLALALPLGGGHLTATTLEFGLAGGVAAGVGIGCLYAALARGRMGIVSPITAVVGASVPVAIGLAFGGRPATLALAGVGCTFAAVALVSIGPDARGATAREPGLMLALVSGLAIGALYVLLSRGGAGAGLWLLAVTRVTSIVLLAVVALLARIPLRTSRSQVSTIVSAGLLDIAANILYVLATRVTLLAFAAVVTSLYPASTVFLARIRLHERLTRTQWIGVAFAATGVVLIALAQ